ncbi:MAG: M48 family metalloprotease, partial [Candidatus Acidiferrales bacterium]
ALLLAAPALAERTRLKPGMNFFNQKQDVELGREASVDAEKQLPLLNDKRVDDYLNRLGQRLARVAPGYKYPYQFKAVNQNEINAFALPGGFLYLNRGTIEAAANESELAGVMAHEISHVALRHGTNQLSKAVLAQAPLALLGGALGGGGSVVGSLAQLGIQVGFTGVFLKFSRTAETQADVLGTQILYDAGMDPQAMADFFSTLEKQSKGGRPPEFFSSHPNPENRQKRIKEEIKNLGPAKDVDRSSEEFRAIQRYLRGLPAAPKSGQAPSASESQSIRRPELPSAQLRGYRHADFALSYPENWEVYEGGSQVVFAPAGAVGGSQIAYGAVVNVFDLESSRETVEQATDRLVRQMISSNPGTQRASRQRARIDGRRGLSTQLRGPSPLQGETEIDYLFTVRLEDRLFYAVFIVPESDYRNYRATFDQMLNSIRLR